MQRDPRLLCELAKAGDRAAFGDLYALYRSDVRLFVCRRIWAREVDDIVQETFLRAWRRMSTFQWTAGGFPGFLRAIARNLVIDLLKSAEYQRSRPVPADWLVMRDGADSARLADPADAAAAADEARRVRVAVAGLRSPDQVESVWLRYIDDLTVKEACERTGLSDGALKASCYRASHHLREALADVP